MSTATETTTDFNDGLRSVKEELRSKQSSIMDSVSTGVNGAANDLKSNKNVDDFRAKLDAQRKKALQEAENSLNAAFDKAAKLGEEHPQMQGSILAEMGVMQNIIAKLVGLINDVVARVISLATDIINGIMGTFEKVMGDYASAAGELLGALV